MVIVLSFLQLLGIGIGVLLVFCVVVAMSIVQPVLLLLTAMCLLVVFCVAYIIEQVGSSLRTWWNPVPVALPLKTKKRRWHRNKGFDFGIKRR